MTPKERVIRTLEDARGDDLYRAESAWRGLSEAELDKEYGQSGRTRREILDGYRRARAEIDAAIEWAKQAQ